MSKLIRKKKEIGAALMVALQLTTLGLIGLILPIARGPQQPVNAPADSQMSAPSQTQLVGALRAPPAGAIRAVKLYEPRATQVFNLASSRAESGRQSAEQSAQQSAQQSMQEGEAPNGATLFTDRVDYPPFSYVYINGTGFEPGETVNMIVVELDPVQQSFEPWDVVADENGNIATSWYISSQEFIGATMQVTATGQTSGFTASATFTDANNLSYSPFTQSLTATAGGPAVSFPQSITAPAGNGDFTATLTVAGTGNPIPSAWVSTLPASLSFSTGGASPSPSPHTDTQTWTVSFNVPSNAACGTYTAQIKADPSIHGVGGASGTAVTLTVAGCASPTPTPTATATASPTPTPTPTPTNQPPVAVCHNVTVSAGANCTGNASIDDGSYDPDSGDTTTLSQSPTGPYSLGTTSVTLTVTDNHGASSTCNATVTVNDITAPVPNAGSLPDVIGQCSANLPTAPTATDNCDGAITGTPSNAGPFGQGDATVTWTFTDSHGNSSTQTQAVHVHDTTPPAPDAASLAEVTGQCSANLPQAPTAHDNCDSGVITGVPDNAGPFGQGDTTITWTFTDSHGNSSTQTQAVHVHDTIPPVPNAPSLPDVTGQCSANLPQAPTAHDNCDSGVITGVPDNAGPFVQGDTTITWTFTDSQGNSSTQTQAVHVHDTIAPVPNAGSLPDVTTQCLATLPSAPIATDNCDGAITGTPSNPGPFGQGDFVITWTFTDSHNNSSTQIQAVHVHDTTAPVPNAGSLPAVTAQCSANLPAAPTATDNCDGAITGTPSNPGPFGQGDFVITWTFTDSHNNSSTQIQAVHVHDTTAPVPNAGSLPAVTAQCSATLPTAPTATDNCDSGVITGTPDMSGPFGQGDFVITWTFTDSHNNSSTQTQAVHVHDTMAPVITHCAANRTITAACSPASTLVPDLTGEVVASDNCSAVTVTQTPAAGTPVVLGNTTVTLHVSDAVGNETTCQAILTVNYNWSGFFQPVDNIPTINRVKAGSAIPVKFSLGCNQGLNIMWTGYPQSGLMQCDNQDPLDDIETTVNAGNSSLNYDPVANQYIYVWKTDRAWAGTCRLLTVKLADGTFHYAFFNFTR
jgi:HYR domain